jgi:hypothetical protein
MAQEIKKREGNRAVSKHLDVSLPSTIAKTPRRPWDAIRITSRFSTPDTAAASFATSGLLHR